MCGIAGYLGETQNPSYCLMEMAKAINHRGPDNQDFGQMIKLVSRMLDYQ